MLQFIEYDENKGIMLDIERKDGKVYAKIDNKYIEVIGIFGCKSNKIYAFDASIYGRDGVPYKILIGKYVEV